MRSMKHHGVRLASFSGVGSVRFTDNKVNMESKPNPLNEGV